MFPHAKNWAKEMLYNILNNEECLRILKKSIHLANQDIILEIFDIISKESKEHKVIIEELKNIIHKKALKR